MTPADHVTTAAISAVGDSQCDQPIELSADATERHVAARFERDAIPLIDRLFTGALRLTGRTQNAEDLVEATMLRAYTGFLSFEEGTNLKAWLYRILHTLWIERHRNQKRQIVEVSVENIDEHHLAAATHSSTRMSSADVAALESLPDREITAALLSLGEEIRIVVYYADVEDFSYQEIANIMNIPVDTVASRLHRGRQRLRTALHTLAVQRGLVPTPTAQ